MLLIVIVLIINISYDNNLSLISNVELVSGFWLHRIGVWWKLRKKLEKQCSSVEGDL